MASFLALECCTGGSKTLLLRGEERLGSSLLPSSSFSSSDRMPGWGSRHRQSLRPPPTRSLARAVLTAAGNPTQQQQQQQRRVSNNMASCCSIYVDPFSTGGNGALPKRMKDLEGGEGSREERERNSVSPEKLDHWMRESISEIVRNIGEAPFLVHIFSNNKGSTGPTTSRAVRLEMEAADAENWPHIRRRWDRGCCPPPDGVILVEELKDEEERGGGGVAAADYYLEDEGGGVAAAAAALSCSKKWGLVVQGRGIDCAAACYILNTCRVPSSCGFCTHFCLARAKCFGDTAQTQLKKAWLLGRHHQ